MASIVLFSFYGHHQGQLTLIWKTHVSITLVGSKWDLLYDIIIKYINSSACILKWEKEIKLHFQRAAEIVWIVLSHLPSYVVVFYHALYYFLYNNKILADSCAKLAVQCGT